MNELIVEHLKTKKKHYEEDLQRRRNDLDSDDESELLYDEQFREEE